MRTVSSGKLSKSQFIKGLQCPLALWLAKYRRELAAPIDAARQALFQTGHELTGLAQQLLPQGVLVRAKAYALEAALAETQQAIANHAPALFEAAACSPEGFHCRADGLRWDSRSRVWDLIEVKSHSEVKDHLLWDAAFQRWVFEQAGHPVGRSELWHVNREYVRRGPLEIEKLFVQVEVTDAVQALQPQVAVKAQEFLSVLSAAHPPTCGIGRHCRRPYACDFIPHCWRSIPGYSVYSMFRDETLETLVGRGIVRLEDVPADLTLKTKEKIELEAWKSGQPHVEPAALNAFLAPLELPLVFLDFETINPAIPLFDGSRPFQQVPFQFSVLVEAAPGGALQARDYLHPKTSDPRPDLIPRLLEACGTRGSIVVYYQPFEAGRVQEMARDFPAWHDPLMALIPRMVDLLVPFSSRALYSPRMESSASLKKVLPAWVPDLSYQGLAIQEGETAARLYLAFVRGAEAAPSAHELFSALTSYCQQDTLAMVRLLAVVRAHALLPRPAEQGQLALPF